MKRHTAWNIRQPFGLSEKMIVEDNPYSTMITNVDLTTVRMLPCRDYRGRFVRGIDMVRRFSQLGDNRNNRLKDYCRKFMMRRMFTTFNTDEYVPMDSLVYAYATLRCGFLNVLVRRIGNEKAHFFLDGTLISTPSRDMAYTVMLYRGYANMYMGLLAPAHQLRGANDYSLAVG